MRKEINKIILLLNIILISFLISGCSGGVDKRDGKAPGASEVLVCTTIYPLYDFAANICGDRARVVQLVPDGVEPHDWEPSPGDMVNLQQADVFVYNGAGLESWVEKTLRNLPEGGPVVIDSSRGIDLLTVNGEADIDVHMHENDDRHLHSQVVDPHIWLDPVHARVMVDNILQGLQQADPGNADYYRDNARRYQARLSELHEKFSQTLAGAPQRKFIVSHAAFGYLAKRYGLEQVPIRGISPAVEPGPARMKEIINVARTTGVRYIFFETLVSPRVSEVIAREVGAQTLVLNPLGGITPEEKQAGKDYISIMEANLQNLAVALGVQTNDH
ncbi:metal ABC transporter substrate-binding protein [Desulfoscipio geothermicus]|uniref:Zinc transport system substrate-binding protein n=1 Tax=Desulfoscipio geothermicus DSM 3669 TaxID=1121426 RepID=A0A1I6E696_9FIRM|nr:metal ABC transporter substrate-binding protein [Desulfoscipio geothermicus]SFR13255.1 zinc transport system substrate-binding protein [Desulfoscipio geothermicus DSM 3669]